MTEPERPKAMAQPGQPSKPAKIVSLERHLIPAEQPDRLSPADAQRIVHWLAADTARIVIIKYGEKRAKQRKITRRQIELCAQKGTITEGPFLNNHGHWQMNLYRHAAGEALTCVVAIDWVTRLLVINAF